MNAKQIPAEAKVAIVNGLACYEPISAVAATIKRDFGIEISPQAIEAHDPTKHAGRRLAAKWRRLFDETRAKFISDCSAIPIAHKSTRLRALHRMSVAAEDRGNFPLAAKLLEQAAKEVGNVFTNRTEHTGLDRTVGPNEPTYRLVSARPGAIFALPDNSRDPKPVGALIEAEHQ